MPVTRVVNGAMRRIGRGLSAAGEFLQDRTRGSDPQADLRPKAGMDDVTLTRKVESVVSRMDGYDKAKIDLNTVDGVVYVRGEAKRPDLVEAIEAAVRGIPEVRDVENLLHLPKTPARTRRGRPGVRPARARRPPTHPRRPPGASSVTWRAPSRPRRTWRRDALGASRCHWAPMTRGTPATDRPRPGGGAGLPIARAPARRRRRGRPGRPARLPSAT
jgi:hypothetical protein